MDPRQLLYTHENAIIHNNSVLKTSTHRRQTIIPTHTNMCIQHIGAWHILGDEGRLIKNTVVLDNREHQ